MLVSVIFIVRRVLQFEIDFGFDAAVWLGLFFTALGIALGIVFTAYFFWWLLRELSGIALDSGFVVKVYCLSNLYKYIPGGIMYVVGRNRLSLEIDELSHSKVLGATLLEGVFTALMAVAFAVLFSYEYFAYFLQEVSQIVWLVLGIGLVVGLAVLIVLREPVARSLQEFAEGASGFSLRMLFWLLVRSLFVVVIMGGGFTVALMLLGQPVSASQFLLISSMYLLAWLAGFLTPGTSGGMGVREAAIIIIMGSFVDAGLLVSAAIVHRILNIAGDLMAYLIQFPLRYIIARALPLRST